MLKMITKNDIPIEVDLYRRYKKSNNSILSVAEHLNPNFSNIS